MKKVIVEVGYYELKVRYAKKGEKGQYYHGAGDMFRTHSTLFNSLENFIKRTERKRFDDSICYHKDLLEDLSDYYDFYGHGFVPVYSDCSEWITNWEQK